MIHLIEKNCPVYEVLEILPEAESWLERHGFSDFAHHTLEEVCEFVSMEIETVMERLDRVVGEQRFEDLKWVRHADIAALIDQIEGQYMPKIQARLERLLSLAQDKSTPDVGSKVETLGRMIKSHYKMEKEIIFPILLQLDQAHRSGAGNQPEHYQSVRVLLRKVQKQHRYLLKQFSEIRHELQNVVVSMKPANWETLQKGFIRLERLFREQLFVEENMLHRMAIQVEEQLMDYFIG